MNKLSAQDIQQGLNTQMIGKQIHTYDSVTSTMDIVWQMCGENRPQGIVVFAENQTRGRGRRGNKWISIYGKGLYFSILLKPDIDTVDLPKITLFIAVAIVKAINKVTDLKALIKCPNDVFINNKKTAGILAEMKGKNIVVGVGLNVNIEKNFLPEYATSLKIEKGVSISRIKLTKEVLKQIDKYYIMFCNKEFETVLKQYKRCAYGGVKNE